MTVAVVLAGGKKPGLNNSKIPVSEALITIGNKYMVEYVVEALRGSKYIDRIVIAGPVKDLERIFGKKTGCLLIQNGDSPVISFLNAMKSIIPYQGKILIVTADVPLVTPQAIDDFIETCSKEEGDLFYPIVSKESNEQKYPGVERTYITLKEGVFTGGNLFFLEADIVHKCAPVAEDLVRLRKKPLRLASYIGLTTLLRYILGMLSLRDVEKKVSEILGVKGSGIISSFPEVGIDVDKESDLILVKKTLCS